MYIDFIKNKKIFTINTIVLVIYILFYLLLFSQFPLKKSIPGNCDTWLVISLSNTYINKISSFFTEKMTGVSLYPVSDTMSYGEGSPGCAAIFILFRLLGFNNIFSYYFFITLLFALTAFGVYLLSGLYLQTRTAAFFAGFAFTCSNFMFANIDDSIVIFYFLSALSLYFVKRFFSSGIKVYLLYGAIIGGLEIYFSLYVFIYQTVALVIISILNFNNVMKNKKLFFSGIFIYMFITFPFIFFYVNSLMKINIVNPWSETYTTPGIISKCSLKLKDFFKVLPGNLIYPAKKTSKFFWPYIRRYAFSGYLIVILALLSLKKHWKGEKELILIALSGFLLSGGQEIRINGLTIHPLFFYLYNLFPCMAIMRVPLRAYFLVTLTISILAAVSLEEILKNIKNRNMYIFFIIAVLLFHSVENIPFPFYACNIEKYHNIPAEYYNFFKNQKDLIILDLPSNIGLDFRESGNNLFVYNREIIYMNWQTQHKQNITGGVNGYYPVSRVIIQKYIDSLPERNSFSSLSKLGVDYIVFHKTMLLPGEKNLLPQLNRSDCVEKVMETGDISIFKMKLPDINPSESEKLPVYREKSEKFTDVLLKFLDLK